MKLPKNKILLSCFIIGSLSPILAIIVNPPHYSFYMFHPATPETWFERIRLFAGNSLLIFGFMVTLFSAITLAFRGIKQKQYLFLLFPVIMLANPMQQPIFLESLDTYSNYRWRDKAEKMNIIGKTPDQIRELFGSAEEVGPYTPRIVDQLGNVTWQGETYTQMNFQPLPFYWLGSNFQVFFVDGYVKNFEANDD